MAYTTRHRSTDSRSTTYRTVEESNNNWATKTSRNEVVSYTGELKTIDDNNNHSFRFAVQNGMIIMSDCVLSSQSRTYTYGSTQAQSGSWSGRVTGDVTGSVWNYPSMPGDLVMDSGRLLLKAYGKMNESALLSGELLHDLGSTISMLRRPFGGAQKLLKQMLKHRNRRLGKTVASVMKANADAWLEYRYGWQPLIIDANTIIDEVHKQRERCKVQRLVARAGATDRVNTSGSWSATVQVKHSGSWSLERSLKTSVGVLYELNPRTKSADVAQILGTRSRDLPATAWEIVPYSFVVDWFVPIGPWLNAVMPDPDITVRGHWITTVSERTFSKSGSQVYFVPGDWYGNCGSSIETTKTYTRLCNTALPSPFVAPTITLSRLHQIDAVSLMLQPVLGALRELRH